MPAQQSLLVWQNNATLTFILRADVGDAEIHLKRHSTLERLASWLDNPEADQSTKWNKPSEPWHSRTIWFDEADGKLYLFDGGKAKSFDPHKEEDLARMVRLLKNLAPRPKGEPMLPLDLPQPTTEQLASATKFLNAMPAHGYSTRNLKRRGGSRTKQSSAKVASAERTSKAFDSILAEMIKGL